MQYDSIVTRVTRLATSVVLAIVFATVPLVADWCAAMCDEANAGATPSCHHTTSPSPRISQKPAPCSHDHRPVVLDAATATKSASDRAAISGPLVSTGLAFLPRLHAVLSTQRSTVTRAPLLALTLASALRI